MDPTIDLVPEFQYVDDKVMVLHDQAAYNYIFTLSGDDDGDKIFACLNDGLNMVANYFIAMYGEKTEFASYPTLTVHHKEGVISKGDLTVSVFMKKAGRSNSEPELATVVESTLVLIGDNRAILVPKFSIQ